MSERVACGAHGLATANETNGLSQNGYGIVNITRQFEHCRLTLYADRQSCMAKSTSDAAA